MNLPQGLLRQSLFHGAFRPGIQFVSVKTTEQQDIKALRSARQLIVEQRTALANQLHTFATWALRCRFGEGRPSH
ncbi:hypothetical protein CF105_15445 [Aeromonas veronii]|nr:hypothetical protein CF105_15445 [Aeromonas veronii]